MRKVISWLVEHWYVPIIALVLLQMWLYGENKYDLGHKTAKALGDQALADLRLEHQTLRANAAEQQLLLYQQQVERANQAEALMLNTQEQLATTRQQLSERIPHVTTVYRPARDAAPVAIPRAVFTCGWLRDYNAALGASVPAPAACTAAAGSHEAAWPTAGSDAELLESGVTPADILAHASDYGLWAQNNLVQLTQLLNLQKEPANGH